MYDYDASDAQIQKLQRQLNQHGISKEQLDLGNYAGLTYREMSGLVQAAVSNKKKKEGKTNA